MFLDLRLQFVQHEVNGGIHIFRLFRGGQLQAFSADLHVTSVPELVNAQTHLHIKSGGFSKKTAQFFKTAAGIFLQMFRRLKVLESKGDVHEKLLYPYM
jgi:hypothetical protein